MKKEEQLLNQAIHLKNAGNKAKATEIFHQLIKEGIDADRAWYHLALMAVDEGKLSQAIECYEKAIEVNADYFKAYNNLGLIYLKQKQYNDAVDCLEKAHDLAPEDMQPLLNLGAAWYQQHDFEAALEYYEQVETSELDPSMQQEVMVSMGDCYLQLRNFKKAKELYEDVVSKLNENHGVALNQLGFIALEIDHDYQQAERWIDRSLAVNPGFKPAVQNKGLILKALKKPQEALQYLNKVVQLDPGNFEGYYNIACVYSDLGQEEQVQANLQKALSLAPFIKDHLKQDPDFKKYIGTNWMKDLLR